MLHVVVVGFLFSGKHLALDSRHKLIDKVIELGVRVNELSISGKTVLDCLLILDGARFDLARMHYWVDREA